MPQPPTRGAKVQRERAQVIRRRHLLPVVLSVVAALTACGGDEPEQADDSQARAGTPVAGATALQATVDVQVATTAQVSSVAFSVATKANGTAQPVRATFSLAYLARQGAITPTTIKLPLFGLYGGRVNEVQVTLTFSDGSTRVLPMSYTAPAYTDPHGVYDQANVLVPQVASKTAGFSYFAMKSGLGAPVVVDVDGEIRWASAAATTGASAFHDNGFVIHGPARQVTRIELDGRAIALPDVDSSTYTAPHHNLEAGKQGLLLEVDAEANGIANVESIVADVNAAGKVMAEWDFEKIMTRHMQRAGDDPTVLVRPGLDWFHMNSAIYDPRDDSIIASSRENFVIKVDYPTGEIKWIFGDPTRYWYTVPSLRAMAITLASPGVYPSGQHALSILADGSLMLFDNGQPASIPPNGLGGELRPYSAVAAFAIDEQALTATERWRFDYGQTIKSAFCSSAYQSADGSTLVTYSTADNFAHTRLVGLDPARNVVFDFEYDTAPCITSWNSIIVPMESLAFR
jgi:hypothetical protein